MPVEQYKYKNAIIRMHGEADTERIMNATIKFMKKARLCKKSKTKERYDGDENKTNAVVKE